MSGPLKRVFEIYVFAFAFLLASRPLSDGDFWFHLKTGEYVIHTGSIPRAEIFSFTNYGAPWIAHAWLSGAIFYAIYSKLGFAFLIFLFALLATLAFWIIFKRSNSHLFLRGFAVLLGVWAVMPNLGVRPRVFTLLLASVFLALLANFVQQKNARAIWWLVPLMVLWVNLHGGFFIGLALIAFTIVGILLDAWSEGQKFSQSWPRIRSLAFVFFGCVIAIGVNPYGLSMYLVPLDVLRSPVFKAAVVDWLSPNFHQSEMLPFVLLVLLTISAMALAPKRISPSRLILFLATLYSALQMQRNILIFSLVAAPLLAEYAQNWLDSTPLRRIFREPTETRSIRIPSIVLSLILLVPLVPFVLKLKQTVYGPLKQETSLVPIQAVEYLKERRITGNTFAFPNLWGGYLIWASPSNPVYFDGRNAYPQEFVWEYIEITNGSRDWREPFNRYVVKIVIIKPRSALARELSESGEWQQVFQDEMSIVFVRR